MGSVLMVDTARASEGPAQKKGGRRAPLKFANLALGKSPPFSDPAAASALRTLAQLLAQSGYAEFTSSFFLLSAGLPRWMQKKDLVPPSLRPLVDLFLLNREVRCDLLPAAVTSLLPALSEVAIVDLYNGLARSPGLSLLPVFGRWVFSQQGIRNPLLYFGTDSEALLRRLVPPPKG